MQDKHERQVTLERACHDREPKTVRVTVHGDTRPDIGSLSVSGPWTRHDIAMDRAELVQLRDAINAVLVATED